MRTDTPVVREHLIDTLRLAAAAGEPALTTSQVVERALPVIQTRAGCRSIWHNPQLRTASVLEEECHGSYHLVTRRRAHHEVYQQLCALERAGKVSRTRHPDRREVTWEAGPAPARCTELETLEQLWRLPAYDSASRRSGQ